MAVVGNKSPSVFLCHASSDKPFVRRLKRSLEASGINVWLDEAEILVGQSIVRSIQSGMKKADYVAVVLSRKSINRPWVKAELAEALTLEHNRKRLTVLPVLYQPVQPPIFLKDKRYADFTDSYKSGLQDLLNAVRPGTLGLQDRLMTVRAEVIIDILRLDASLARFTKKVKQCCIRARVDDVVDTLSVDTGELRNVQVKPGRVKSEWVESGITYIRSELPRPLMPGQTITREVSATIVDCLSADEDYWEFKVHYPVQRTQMTVRFPKGRPPIEWGAFERRGSDAFPLKHVVRKHVLRGAPAITMTLNSPRLHSGYVLRWKC